jgi:hypothetical protein
MPKQQLVLFHGDFTALAWQYLYNNSQNMAKIYVVNIVLQLPFLWNTDPWSHVEPFWLVAKVQWCNLDKNISSHYQKLWQFHCSCEDKSSWIVTILLLSGEN